jgi:hypothetical protein
MTLIEKNATSFEEQFVSLVFTAMRNDVCLSLRGGSGRISRKW